MASASSLRILVLGYIVRCPLGGFTWTFLSFLLGLQRLGHQVWFLEDSEDYASCYDPTRHVVDKDPTKGLRYAERVFAQTGFGANFAYYDAHTQTWHGPSAERMEEICKSADLLINISGINPLRPWLENVPRRAYVDIDPAFDQVRNLIDPDRRARTLLHNVFFTIGENIPVGKANLPDDGFAWQATRQPVVLDRWTCQASAADASYTTIMNWDSYDTREYAGQKYGMKADSFAPYMGLARKSKVRLELALGGPNAPRERLREMGWSVVDPVARTVSPSTFQRYIHRSKAEFTVAKHGYVVSNSAWFSDRSAYYLASGRPVLTQETGFSEHIPTGEGLLSFRSPQEALAGIEEIENRYEFHCRKARELAIEYFDSDKLLASLVERAINIGR